MNTKPSLLFVLCLFAGGLVSRAQTATTASGGAATGPGGRADYTIGQTFFANFSSSAGAINDGIQHSAEGYLTIPVTYTSFNAVLSANGKVVLTWKTASEKENSHFVVEKSNDGKRYVTHATIAGNGTTTGTQSYYAVDHQPDTGVNYYRLKQVDMNGLYNYSAVRAITVSRAATRFSVYPNPATDFIVLQAGTADADSYRIFDNQGREVKNKAISGQQTRIDLRGLPASTYFMHVMKSGKIIQSFKIEKTHNQ